MATTTTSTTKLWLPRINLHGFNRISRGCLCDAIFSSLIFQFFFSFIGFRIATTRIESVHNAKTNYIHRNSQLYINNNEDVYSKGGGDQNLTLKRLQIYLRLSQLRNWNITIRSTSQHANVNDIEHSIITRRRSIPQSQWESGIWPPAIGNQLVIAVSPLKSTKVIIIIIIN